MPCILKMIVNETPGSVCVDRRAQRIVFIGLTPTRQLLVWNESIWNETSAENEFKQFCLDYPGCESESD